MKKIKAFTLMEIMIVVVILGIMATFAVPSFTKSLEKAYSRDARNNLMAIHAAQMIYFAQNGAYWGAGNLTAINTGLRLNIIANGVNYNCAGGGVGFSCNGQRGGAWGFTVTVDQNAIVLPNGNPNCPSAICQ